MQRASVASYSERCSYFTDSCHLMKAARSSSETSVLTRAMGVTSQKTPFFKVLLNHKAKNLSVIYEPLF
jgi:hypothetical protein